jgi:hypothetical protein
MARNDRCPGSFNAAWGDVPLRCIDMNGKSNIVRAQRGFEDTIRRQHALELV